MYSLELAWVINYRVICWYSKNEQRWHKQRLNIGGKKRNRMKRERGRNRYCYHRIKRNRNIKKRREIKSVVLLFEPKSSSLADTMHYPLHYTFSMLYTSIINLKRSNKITNLIWYFFFLHEKI